jgi:allophanate hydrolase subunit 2
VDLDRSVPVRVLPGPHVDRFARHALDELCATDWEITEQADRMGYRLVGPRLGHTRGADVASLGLPVGAVQVPGDGRPIVLLADHQPTGGYTVLACVIRADLGLLAQRAPGEQVRFALTTPEEARAALAAQHAALRAISGEDGVWSGLRWAESGGQAVARS